MARVAASRPATKRGRVHFGLFRGFSLVTPGLAGPQAQFEQEATEPTILCCLCCLLFNQLPPVQSIASCSINPSRMEMQNLHISCEAPSEPFRQKVPVLFSLRARRDMGLSQSGKDLPQNDPRCGGFGTCARDRMDLRTRMDQRTRMDLRTRMDQRTVAGSQLAVA